MNLEIVMKKKDLTEADIITKFSSSEYEHETIHFIPELVDKIREYLPHARIKQIKSDSETWNLETYNDNYLNLLKEGFKIFKDQGYGAYQQWDNNT